MIKCQNLTKSDIDRIGEQVSESFLAERGCFSDLEKEDAKKLFKIVVETCYRSGHLYTTSENEEGYCVYWTKSERPGLLPQARMGLKMAFKVPMRVGKVLKNSQNNWEPTEKRYKTADDFVEVFLIVVRKEYQGQGYFRKMLEEPFALARKNKTICVLDTDSPVKAAKYRHVGMHVVQSKIQRSGVEMFALEYE